jgi:hypothetical protein
MSQEESKGCLLVSWEDGVRLYLVDEYPRDGIVVGGSLFKPFRPGKFLYLYDWLRQPGGQACGVRFSVDGEAAPVAAWLASRPGVRVLPNLVFEIFFPGCSAESCYSEEEQYVANDPLESDGGSFALALELWDLEGEAVQRLRAERLPSS